MPNSNDSLKFLINRDGISQKQRQAVALDPSYVKLDERKLEDFLIFAMEYSKKINFFDLNNKPKGTWEGFWNSDPTIVIAAITKTNPLPAKLSFEKIISNEPTVHGLSRSFDSILDVVKKIDYWYNNIPLGTSLQIELRRMIMANFNRFLHEVASLDKSLDKFVEGYTGYSDNIYRGFSPVWGFGVEATKPEANRNMLIPTPEINKENTHICSDNLSKAQMLVAAYSILKKLFTNVYNVYLQIVQISSSHLDQSLSRADHPPHIALFISFLKLFLQVQEDLNQMTKRHLDFFYRDVLGLKPKGAVADKAHVFFELAKNRLEHPLESNVRLKAGKDEEGNDLFYTLEKTSVFNTAKVESLRTFYIDKSEEYDSYGLKAAPIANSEDGLGTPVQDGEMPTWYTMGSPQMPDGIIGFALASQELLLTEGTRKVTVTLTTNDNVPEINENAFHVFFSGKGKWISASFSASQLPDIPKGFIIVLTLDPDTPSILPFDPDEFEEDLGTDLPVLKILINPEKLKNPQTFEIFQNLKVQSITLKTEVEDLTQVVAFNDEGKLDTGKPFLPFTSIPKVESSYYIGNKEAFQKNLTKLEFKINWENRPADFDEYYAGYEFKDGQGNIKDHITFKINARLLGENLNGYITINNISGNTEDLLPILKTDSELFVINKEISKLISGKKADTYGDNNIDGFIRLDLLNDFGHSQYQKVLTRQMLAVARFPTQVNGAWYIRNNGELEKAPSATKDNNSEVIIPNPPYTPSIKSITIDYESFSTTNANENGHIQFIHLHPFENTYEHIKKINNSHLLPQFKIHKTSAENSPLIKEEGALIIGMRDLLPKQSLSLLFQLVENSADAALPKPKVRWYYLKSNQWKPFKESGIISDTTDELLTRGIIEFSIPPDINKENTILPPDLHWLKASVSKNPKAISHAIGVHAQAALLTFQDNNNNLGHLKRPLPAETITKLENDDAAIKGLSQLYDSFDGRPAESDLSFYTRVSEHLRHKGRAITLFDYERLVLEAFPSIYKVRCVNHTDDTFHLRPGHVIITVVPDFSKLKAVDRRHPKVSLAQLEKIRRFLEERNSAFVGNPSKDNPEGQSSLHVLNPMYEKIKVSFNVRFLPEIAAVEFHIEKLKNALVRFMSPWAFEDSADISFGGKVFKSVLLHFVEKQPYVDYVKDFQMMLNDTTEDINIIESKTPISILVPVTENEMDIVHIFEEECISDKLLVKKGFGYENLEETEII